MRKIFSIAISCFLLFYLLPARALPLNELKLPSGFQISVYARVPGARQLALGDSNIVFVGTQGNKVYALLPNHNLTASQQVIEFASRLNAPNGVAFHQGSLYVAEIDKIRRYDNVASHLLKNNKMTSRIIFDQLPTLMHHGYRYIKFGPDNFLYIGIGFPCNVCLPKDYRYGTIARVKEDGSHFEIYAKGVRNSMGFDWHPTTHFLWFTDNGEDWLGDNLPPDELNLAQVPGMHFGFPFYDATLPDPKYNKYKNPREHYVPPILALGPHVAALGMTFLYWNSLS